MNQLVGHEMVLERFRKSAARNRLASTYLFSGRDGIGKRTFALHLAQSLLCERDTDQLQACCECTSCKQVESQTHPDLILLSKPEDKNYIPVELFIGDREHRRRVGLCHDISLTPFYGKRKVAIIDDADFMNAESANSLLKTLEEPPPNSILILIGTSEHRQLPTILSRSQVIRFQPLRPDQLACVLSILDLIGDVATEKLVAAADGSVGRAIKLDDHELFDFRSQLFNQLASLDPADGGFAKQLTDFVDGRSKESSVRRKELRLIADFATQFFSDALRVSSGHPLQIEDSGLRTSIDLWQTNLNKNGHIAADIAADSISRTGKFENQIAANLATANIVPAWLNDLGAIARMQLTLA